MYWKVVKELDPGVKRLGINGTSKACQCIKKQKKPTKESNKKTWNISTNIDKMISTKLDTGKSNSNGTTCKRKFLRNQHQELWTAYHYE